jgi:DNA-directed RNA polymerase beta subunit
MVLPLDTEDVTAVYVIFNGEIMGVTRDPEELVLRLRRMARDRITGSPYNVPTIYVSPCGGHVYVYYDEGRVMRPLLVLREGRLPDVGTDLQTLLAEHRIRYMDAAEVNTLDVALPRRTMPRGDDIRPGYRAPRTGCGPSERQAVAGRGGRPDGGARPPDPRRDRGPHPLPAGRRGPPLPPSGNGRPGVNQSPRNAYQTSMGRQAVGAPLPPGPFELSPALCYAQQPLCPATAPNTAVQAMECGLPLGQNLVVAVCSYGGCNRCFH